MAVVVLAANLLLVQPLTNLFGGRFFIAYLLVQIILYIANFIIQGKFVYKRQKTA